MFQVLYDIFQSYGYYIEIEICKLRGACCDLHNPVIDFNTVKTKLCQQIGCNQPKSVNGLLFYHGYRHMGLHMD